jgi:hypothetical protein
VDEIGTRLIYGVPPSRVGRGGPVGGIFYPKSTLRRVGGLVGALLQLVLKECLVLRSIFILFILKE